LASAGWSWLLITCLAALAWAFPAGAQETGRQTILARGDDSYPPYEFLDGQGNPSGFNIDLFKAVAGVMGLHVDIKLGPWNEVRQDLEQGRIDVITGMFYSRRRDELVDFSTPYIWVSYALFVRDGSGPGSLEEAKGAEVIVQRGDMGDDYITRQHLASKITRVPNPEAALRLLASSEHDCAFLPRLQGLYLANKQGLDNIQAVGPPVLPRKYCFAVKEGDQALLALLNEGLSVIKQSGEYGRIYQKWFGVYEKKTFHDELRFYALWALVPILALLALFLAWLWSLRRAVANKTKELVGELAERQRAENALQDSENKYRLLVEKATDAIFILQDGAVKFANPMTLRLSGYSAEELAGLPFQELIHPEERPRMYRQYEQTLRGEDTPSENTLRALGKGGDILWLQANHSLIQWQGRPAVFVIARDMTTHMEMERQLRQSQKMEALGTLAGGVAHDFNNILGVIMGYAELAMDAARQGADNGMDIEEIIKATQRARDMVRQILTFSRKVDPNLEPCDLNKEILQIKKVLEHTLPKMIRIKTHLASDLRPVKIDAGQMEQVLINLAANAADAMPDGGELVIETKNQDLDEEYCQGHLEAHSGAYVVLQVSDSGHGMDETTRRRIFDPFFTTKQTGKGTGLGLSSVFGIVKGHGGLIYCYSEPGQGTIFKIYLPAHETEGTRGPSSPAESGVFSGRGETVLLVDDEETLLDLGKQILMGAGYKVIKAVNGEEALAIHRSRGPEIDLVILDLNMPGMGGHRCLLELMARDPGLKILIASGYSVNGAATKSLQAGAAGFISKPYRKDELFKSIRRVLDG